MCELNTALYYLDDVESAARRDVAQSRRFDRSRTLSELMRDLVDTLGRAFSPFGKSRAVRPDARK